MRPSKNLPCFGGQAKLRPVLKSHQDLTDFAARFGVVALPLAGVSRPLWIDDQDVPMLFFPKHWSASRRRKMARELGHERRGPRE